jgi:thiamine-monophosphate kinase
MPGEFEIIARYFKPLDHAQPAVILGMGDDAALLSSSKPLAITMDTLVEGRHFLSNDPPRTLGHKALAVNLSDLAAMGATPLCFLLSLTLSQADESWLAAFSLGMDALAKRYGVTLIGGDTTSGPLSITITAMGQVDPAHHLRRDAAQLGDDIYVTGHLGAAALFALSHHEGLTLSDDDFKTCQQAYQCPQPRIEVGQALATCAHACIDISDGLISDLGHILKASNLGATLDVSAIPLASALSVLGTDRAQQLALSGGDDYELCFTAPHSVRTEIEDIGRRYGVPMTRIGEVTHDSGNITLMRDNRILDWRLHGWEHF